MLSRLLCARPGRPRQLTSLTRPAVWISIKPRFAKAIFDGLKKYELRRIAPRVEPGSIALVYASAPIKSLVGAFRMRDIVVRPLDSLWSNVGHHSAIDRAAYDSYFAGKENGAAITIGQTWQATRRWSLDELRSRWPAFRPPQSYRYISTMKSSCDLRLSLIHGPTLLFSPRKLCPPE